jgi:hypothetical protein
MADIVSLKPATALDLETRVADALGAALTSEEISALIIEISQAVTDAQAISLRASERALDPATRPEFVADAHKAMMEADFRARRMTIALERFQAMKAEAVRREQASAAHAEFLAAKAERDELVNELRAVYPELAGKIADLIGRVAANQKRVERANQSIPAGEKWMASAETLARDASPGWSNSLDESLQKLTDFVRLPKFKVDPNDNYGRLWPPKGR